jgi:hypothetical protein
MNTATLPVMLHGAAGSAPLRAAVRPDVDELKQAFPAITECRLDVRMVNGDTLPRFSVHLDLRLPQRQIIVSGEPRKTMLGALHAALGTARAQLSRRS